MAALFAILRFQLSRHQPALGVRSLWDDLGACPEVLLAFEITGEYDLLALVRVRDMVAYNQVIDRVLAANPIVERYETSFIKTKVKSVFADDLLDLEADDAAGSHSDYAEAFWVNHNGGLVRVRARDIDRIAAERDYMRLHVGDRGWLLHSTITELAKQLDPACFIRLHRSAIVRRDFVLGLEHETRGGWVACLADGSRQKIARSHLAEAMLLAGRGTQRPGAAPPSEHAARAQ